MSYNDLRKGRYSEPGREYLVTTVVDGREQLFDNLYLARCVVNVLRDLQFQDRVVWQAWVLMPDHFHALVAIRDMPLSAVMSRMKGESARRVNRLRCRSGRLWQPGFHDRALRREDDRKAVARYLVANPLRAGLVGRIGEYAHWDSVWL